MARYALVATILLLITSSTSDAQMCRRHSDWVTLLTDLGESVIFQGTGIQGELLEIWVDPEDQSWSLLVIDTNRDVSFSCLRVHGTGYVLPIPGRINSDV